MTSLIGQEPYEKYKEKMMEQQPLQKRELLKIHKSKRYEKSKQIMNKGIKTVLYPVKDMEKSKVLFTKFLGVEPYADSPYYIGYKIDGQDIGLIPSSPEGATTAYFHVDDIKNSLQVLVDDGATILRDINDVGGGRLVASVKDASNNIIGLVQN